MHKISVVINTLNEEKNLPRAISSVKNIADEIIVVDMQSTDRTVSVAKELGAQVYKFRSTGYVEPARNFAISKATGDWVVVLDADEEFGAELKKKILILIKTSDSDFFRIPRKNIIFGKWIKHTLWWPDYQIRFFRRGRVTWSEIIHSIPTSTGKGEDLPADESLAILHHNYSTLEEYLIRMDRYTSIQADFLQKDKYKFFWLDLLVRPWKEFVGRYFVGEGYKDGVHGLALSLLQAFSELVTYIKVWQSERYIEQNTDVSLLINTLREKEKELFYYQADILLKQTGSIIERIKRKLRLP